jgi:uroporphyrinogen decarboxylase
MDNCFERLRMALTLAGKPDRVPLIELDIDRQVMAAYLGRPIQSMADWAAFYMAAGYDYVPVQVGLMEVGSPIATEATIHHRHSYSVYTDAETERKWAALHDGVIRSVDDLRAFPWPRQRALDMSLLDETAQYLPEGVKLVAIIGKVFTAAWMLMGFEAFAFGMVEEPELVAALMATTGEIQLEATRRAAAHPAVGAVFHPDDIAYTEGLLLAPGFFREHLFPWYARMGEACRERDVLMAYHSDGDLTEVLEDLIGCGFCAIHPIEPKAMDARELKRRVGDRLCLLGNIEVDRLARGTPEEIRGLCEANIRDLAGDGGYCLGSSNSVTDYVRLENYLAMLECARRGAAGGAAE